MMKEYLKHISTPQTADLLKKPKKLTIDKWGKAHSKDKNDYDFNGKLINGGKLYEEQEKQSETSRGIQVALNQIGQRDRQGKELKTDGVFGPITQAAYNDYWQKTYPKETNHLQDIYKPIMAKTVTANIFDKGATQGNAKLDKGFINTTIKADPLAFKQPNNVMTQPSKATALLSNLPNKYVNLQKNNPVNEIFNGSNTFYNKGTELGKLGQNLSFPMLEQFNEKSINNSLFHQPTYLSEALQRQSEPEPVLENILAPDKVGDYSTQEIDDYLKELFKDDEWAKYGLDKEFWENEVKMQEDKWKEKTEIVGDIIKPSLVGIPRFIVPQIKDVVDLVLNTKTKPAERNAILEYPSEAANYILRGLDGKARQARDKIYGDLEHNLLNYDGAMPNAFLHTYWNALMTYYGGKKAAERFATAHETQTRKATENNWLDNNPNKDLEQKYIPTGITDNFTGEQQLWMDMHNNEIGRGLADKINKDNVHDMLLKYYKGSEEKLKEARKEYKNFSDADLLLLHLSAEAVKKEEAMWLIHN